jgi:hypothetical protein
MRKKLLVLEPARVRAFVDLALERLPNNPDYQLTEQELAQAKKRIRSLKITHKPE